MREIDHLLVANRGEIAIRVMRAASEEGIAATAVHTADDATSLHVIHAERAQLLPGLGVAGYLDIGAIIDAAAAASADAVHPGYGFLAENAELARACAAAGLTFVGPTPELLELFGDKVSARAAAAEAGLPILAGSTGPATVDEAARLLDAHGAVMLKAVGGGGGRGMRAVRSLDELGPAWDRCVSEATKAFGRGDVYVEQLVDQARHIEVQIIGDGSGEVTHLGARDCSVQRRNQKVVEIAPIPNLAPEVVDRICAAAVDLGRSVDYRSVGTVEFLVDAEAPERFWFIETNARIQVEHTVTEQVTGVDLVACQLRLAAGASIAEIGLSAPPPIRGWSIQARINAETIDGSGLTRPSGGTISVLELASGPGVRVDSAGYAGLTISPSFDSLLAKLIVTRSHGSFAQAAAKLEAALAECRIEGVETNLAFLRAIAGHELFRSGLTTTSFVAEQIDALTAPADGTDRSGRYPSAAPFGGGADESPAAASNSGFDTGGTGDLGDGLVAARTPLQGTVVSVEVAAGDPVHAGQLVAVIEAMKMEHEVLAPAAGTVDRCVAAPGEVVWDDQPILIIAEGEVAAGADARDDEIDLDEIRPSLAEVLTLRARMMDEARPAAVERRRKTDQRTARENLADLVDLDGFVEYGPMALAAQRRRRTREDLIDRSPADGLITGVGAVNGDRFDDPDSRCAVMIYDYTVFAGTQGIRNHAKTDRIIDIAADGRMPLILFAEGGGGRPGDTDGGDFGSRTFSRFATLSGLVPMVGVVSGYCFAGNASLLGCCDVIIATRNTNIGMGGPAMIEGGGLGVFAPTEIGPAAVHTANGVIDVLVDDEAEATAVAKKYLAYFQGPIDDWEAHDQRMLRQVIPENRLRSYDIRTLIETLADVDSVLELRKDFGIGVVTALIRIEGKPLGLLANNPNHLGGAIDSDAADKGARFMQLCDAHDLPVLSLVDTPGIMVGPEVEKTALVRHANRMFLIGANLDVPTFAVIVRKAYGLGGIAMTGGSFRVPMFGVAWPTAEFGPMGLEGSVKLGFRAELAAIEDEAERAARYDELVEKEYQRGKALNHATGFAVDDTIDPAETRHWLANMMSSIRSAPARDGKKRPAIDGW